MALPTAPPTVQVVTLEIDGRDLSARNDESIIEVCRENGIAIPSLCYLDGLSVWGACRLCMVEVNGQERLFSACSTRVVEGMKVRTGSERLARYRRVIVEMLLAERNHSARCAYPTATANCRHWRSAAAWTMCACPTARCATRWTARTRASASTTTAACCARAACASATRSKGPTAGRDGPRRRLPGDRLTRRNIPISVLFNH